MDRADADMLVAVFGWAGQHAWPLYLAWLALTLAGTAAATWWLGSRALPAASVASARHAGPLSNTAATMPTHRTQLQLGLGLTMLAAGTVGFAVLASQLGTGAALDRADLAFAAGVHAHLPPDVKPGFAMLTVLANTATLTGLGVLMALSLLLRGRHRLALVWVLAVGGNSLLNPALKQLFERARPAADQAYLAASGYSFPSGHSSGALVAYGMWACLAQRALPARWRPVAFGAAVLMIGTVGTSRLFLGVHYASDVLAGYASGMAWLGVCLSVLAWFDRSIAMQASAPGR